MDYIYAEEDPVEAQRVRCHRRLLAGLCMTLQPPTAQGLPSPSQPCLCLSAQLHHPALKFLISQLPVLLKKKKKHHQTHTLSYYQDDRAGGACPSTTTTSAG